VLLKQEAGNPTGSFKDRGLSLAVNRARELGATGVQLPSAGNAAIALAAYAAAAGLTARVALPLDTPRAIEERCRAYGAEVHRAGRTLVESGARLAGLGGELWTLATLKEPYRVEGKKTMGLELAEQLDWELPDWIVYPTGGGTGIVGMAKAFDELEALGLIDGRRPRLVVAQATGCAPLVRAFEEGHETATPWEDPRTAVWGLRVPQGVGDFLVLRALRRTRGLAVAIDESVLPEVGARYTRGEGVVVGPEGALALAALELLHRRGDIRPGERAVVFQTGHPANYAV
jgi:threonine synthase